MATIKSLSTDPRIRGIVQKHMTALSREIAQELTQPLLEQLGMTLEDLGAVIEPAESVPERTSTPLTPMALIYDARTRRWICPRCQTFADVRRRSVTTHLRFCEANPQRAPHPEGDRGGGRPFTVEGAAKRVRTADRAAKRAAHAKTASKPKSKKNP